MANHPIVFLLQTIIVWNLLNANQHSNSNSEIKVMFREHDHTVECIAWAPNSAYKPISEAFEEVRLFRQSACSEITNSIIRLFAEEKGAPRPVPHQRFKGQDTQIMGRGDWRLFVYFYRPRQLGERRVLASSWQVLYLRLR